MATNRSCLICTAPSIYDNYGVTSCRSCADFYKRTVINAIVYPCRKGDGKCTIRPKDRHNCRGCRFARCKSLGMKWDSTNTDDTFPSTKKMKAIPTAKHCDIKDNTAMKSGNAVGNPEPSRFIDHTTFYEPDVVNSKTPLLDKIKDGFSYMCLIRLSGELKLRNRKRGEISVENLTLTLAYYPTMVPVHMILKEGLIEFANVAFEEFRCLDAAEKEKIVESRLPCFDLLESTYRACQHFPGCKEVRMCGYSVYFKVTDVEKVLENCEDDVDEQKLASEWKKVLIQLSRIVRYHFDRTKPTDYEFLALLGLAFWSEELSDESTKCIANKARSEILKELYAYYSDRGTENQASRECAFKVAEDFEVCRLMNMFETALNIESINLR